MKLLKYSLLLIVLSPTIIMAETINTGNAYVNTSISTNANDGTANSNTQINVQSSGESSVSVNSRVESKSTSTNTTSNNTYKKIEVDVNGEKKVVESNEPGEIKVEIGTKKTTPTPKDNELGKSISNWITKFIADLFSKIFK